MAGVEGGKVAADIGAGTGFITEGFLRKGLSVVAVDRSPEMLGRIRAKYGSPAPVDCRLGTARRLPLDDGEVD